MTRGVDPLQPSSRERSRALSLLRARGRPRPQLAAGPGPSQGSWLMSVNGGAWEKVTESPAPSEEASTRQAWSVGGAS